MKRLASILLIATLVIAVGSPALSYRDGKPGGEGDFAIYVAPSTIVTSAQGQWITIHTSVPYRAVSDASAAIDGDNIDIAITDFDSRGQFVAKLRYADAVALCAPPSAVVSLTLVVDGSTKSASEEVPVRD